MVWSGDRKPDPKTGKVPAVGNTVDVKTATYTNSIGATELIGEWTDPSFDPDALRNLLRPRARDSHAALVHVLGRQAEPAAESERRGHCPAARLDIAHLVHAGETIGVVS